MWRGELTEGSALNSALVRLWIGTHQAGKCPFANSDSELGIGSVGEVSREAGWGRV